MNASATTGAPALRQTELLDDLDEAARQQRFDALQQGLPEIWRSIRKDDPLESVVVVPSMSIDRMAPSAGAMNQAMEERLLFLLLLLRQPRLRMVYVTSQPIDPMVVEYYLSLLPGVIPSHARSRLHLVSVGDGGRVSGSRYSRGTAAYTVPRAGRRVDIGDTVTLYEGSRR